MTYHCEKCKMEIFGTSEPKGFIFAHWKVDTYLCRECYIDFLDQFKEKSKCFVEEFLRGNENIN